MEELDSQENKYTGFETVARNYKINLLKDMKGMQQKKIINEHITDTLESIELELLGDDDEYTVVDKQEKYLALNQDLLKLKNIMDDMKDIINFQQKDIDTLETFIVLSNDNVVQAELELLIADTYQKSTNKSWLVLLLAIPFIYMTKKML